MALGAPRRAVLFRIADGLSLVGHRRELETRSSRVTIPVLSTVLACINPTDLRQRFGSLLVGAAASFVPAYRATQSIR
jgi:hypothetical protein